MLFVFCFLLCLDFQQVIFKLTYRYSLMSTFLLQYTFLRHDSSLFVCKVPLNPEQVTNCRLVATGWLADKLLTGLPDHTHPGTHIIVHSQSLVLGVELFSLLGTFSLAQHSTSPYSITVKKHENKVVVRLCVHSFYCWESNSGNV